MHLILGHLTKLFPMRPRVGCDRCGRVALDIAQGKFVPLLGASGLGTVAMRRLMLGEIVLLLWLSAGPGWAGFEEGMRAYQSGDYPTAVSALLPLAQQGDARAQFLLGALYAQGHGVPQDYGAAAQWFRRAAEQGHAAAQFNLGVWYHEGRGCRTILVRLPRGSGRRRSRGLPARNIISACCMCTATVSPETRVKRPSGFAGR